MPRCVTRRMKLERNLDLLTKHFLSPGQILEAVFFWAGAGKEHAKRMNYCTIRPGVIR